MIRRALLTLAASSLFASAAPPNLVVVHTDEHNFRTLGCYRKTLPAGQGAIWGKQAVVNTPHIDSIAARGVLCTSFYATTPVCTPSRASMMTGMSPPATGSPTNNQPLHDDVVTFAQVLSQEGYATGYFGKWHLDGPGKPQWGPERKFGWADNRFMFNRGHWKKFGMTKEGSPQITARGKGKKPGYGVNGADAKSFSTDWLMDRALEFVRVHKDKPFCTFISLPDPHGPNTVRAPYDTMFDGVEFEDPATMHKAAATSPKWGKPQVKKLNQKSMQNYLGMVKCIDDNVGKLLKTLKKEGLLENTIIVFTSDHGDLMGEHGRHNKGLPYETSAGVAFVAAGPGVADQKVVHQALDMTDFGPSMLALMGAKGKLQKAHGRDASPLLTSGKPPEKWRDLVFLRSTSKPDTPPTWVAAVSARWKLVLTQDDVPWLFDLENDPHELKNAARANPDQVKKMATALMAWLKKTGDPAAKDEKFQKVFSETALPAQTSTATSSPVQKKKRPNILWIFSEDLSPYMGCYDDPINKGHTPSIDTLASQGVLFRRAYMPAPVCSACRSAMITGVMQTTTGTHQHRSSRAPGNKVDPETFIKLPTGVKTIPERMRDAGYFTFNSGKDDYNFHYDRRKLYSVGTRDNYRPGMNGWQGNFARHSGSFTKDTWKSRPDKNQPWFGQIMIWGGKAGNKHVRKGEKLADGDVPLPPYFPDTPAHHKSWTTHYNAARGADARVQEILDLLKADGELENTIVFFFSDHGNNQSLRHKQFCYEGGVHVPLMITGNHPALKAGTVRNDLVSGLDISATTLAMGGAKMPEILDGHNLFAPDFVPRDFVISARDRCDYTIDRIRTVRSDRMRYIRNGFPDRPMLQAQYRDHAATVKDLKRLHAEGKLTDYQDSFWFGARPKEELYDIAKDPHQMHNLADDPAFAAELKKHRAILEAWIEETGDKGQSPEDPVQLKATFDLWKAKPIFRDAEVNPEYDQFRQ